MKTTRTVMLVLAAITAAIASDTTATTSTGSSETSESSVSTGSTDSMSASSASTSSTNTSQSGSTTVSHLSDIEHEKRPANEAPSNSTNVSASASASGPSANSLLVDSSGVTTIVVHEHANTRGINCFMLPPNPSKPADGTPVQKREETSTGSMATVGGSAGSAAVSGNAANAAATTLVDTSGGVATQTYVASGVPVGVASIGLGVGQFVIYCVATLTVDATAVGHNSNTGDSAKLTVTTTIEAAIYASPANFLAYNSDAWGDFNKNTINSTQAAQIWTEEVNHPVVGRGASTYGGTLAVFLPLGDRMLAMAYTLLAAGVAAFGFLL